MNPQEYTLSRKDKKFLSALMCAHLSLVMVTVSAFGWYWHGQTEDCRKLWKKYDLADWATEEVDKAKTEHKLESMKQIYKNQGISAEEY